MLVVFNTVLSMYEINDIYSGHLDEKNDVLNNIF